MEFQIKHIKIVRATKLKITQAIANAKVTLTLVNVSIKSITIDDLKKYKLLQEL
ncbi:hypothetical protein T11_12112 [Trichinella zimbabwensis]|uniref:Uncharacterized protein n=1 Tax=Trichinella zimbabwensis TaxID=268475 RepID=A0A0V1GL78_9BILA|nr:hypothetical protein T11_12112 [Trichinella zimbabwensis]